MSKHWADKGNQIKTLADPLIKLDFPYLAKVKINYIFREPSPKDPGSRFGVVAGHARSIPAKEFDLYGFHFEICMSAEVWQTATPDQKKRLTWHELRHCMFMLDEEGQPVTDKEGRVKTYIEPHDIFLYGFRDEYERFGFTEQSDREAALFLAQISAAEKSGGGDRKEAEGKTEWTRYVLWRNWGDGEDEEQIGAFATVKKALTQADRSNNAVEDVEKERHFKVKWKNGKPMPPLITVNGKKRPKWAKNEE